MSDTEELDQPLIPSEREDVSVDELIAYREAMQQILTKAVYIGASYTGSFSFIIIAILAGHIQKESDDDINYLSATTLMNSMFYSAEVIGCSSGFAVLYYIMEKLGQYNNPQLSVEQKEIHRNEIARLVKNIFLFSLVSLPAFTALIVFFLSKLIMQSLFSQNQRDVELAQQYLNIAAWTILPLAMRLGFEQILFPFNKQFQVMCIALSTFSLGVMLAAVLCYTFDLKLQGIAIAFLVEAFITQFSFGYYLNVDKDLKPFSFFNVSWYDAEDLQQVWALNKIGLPITVSISSELIAFFLINQFAGWISSDALAAQDIASQVFFYTFIPSFAIAQVAAMKTGELMGDRDYQNAVRYAKAGLLAVSLVLGFGCLIPLQIYPGLMRAIVTNHANNHEAEMSDSAVRLAAATAFVMAISNVLLQTVRCYNAQDFVPTYLSAGAAFLGVALSYLLGFQAKWGLDGVIAGYGIGITAGAFALFALSSQRITVNALRQRQREVDASQASDNDLENSDEDNQETSVGLCQRFCTFQCPSLTQIFAPRGFYTRSAFN